MTDDIMNLMYQCDHVHVKATQINDSKLWQDHRNLRNKVTLLSRSERMYISMIFIHSAEITPQHVVGNKTTHTW